MSATHSPGDSYDRIEAIDLVIASAVIREVPEDTTRLVFGSIVFAFFFAVDIIFVVAFGAALFVGVIPAIVVAIFSARKVEASRLEFVADAIHDFWVTRRQPPDEQESDYGSITSANGLHAGQLACSKKVYDQHRREHRENYGRSAVPLVTYHLVLATYPKSGTQQVVAFTNGRHLTWHSMSNVIVDNCVKIDMLSDYERSDATRRVAGALEELVTVLVELEDGEVVQRLAERLVAYDNGAIEDALDVALHWNMVCLSRDEAPTANSVVRLTRVGFDWYLASSEFQPKLSKGRVVEDAPEAQNQINIGAFAGILNIASGDISGTNIANAEAESLNDRLIASMAEILALREIPWSDSRLVEARADIEDAVKQNDPSSPSLKRAFAMLQKVCSEVAFGVLGNGAYQLLIQHFL